MELSTRPWQGADLFDAAYLDLAKALIAEGRVSAIRDLMLVAGRHPDLWESEAGSALLADLLALLLDGLAAGRVADVVPALSVCPPRLAQRAIDLLIAAFFPNGAEVRLARLDDAALLLLGLLDGAVGHRDQAVALIDSALANRYSEDFGHAAHVVRSHLQRVESTR